MLTGQRFQAELSPSFLQKFTEFRAETPPHAFGIPNCVTPPHIFGIPVQETPPSPSEFQDAARGIVWIFSGITPSVQKQKKEIAQKSDYKTVPDILHCQIY